VSGSKEPLDASRVHPERYAALEACAARHGRSTAELRGEAAAIVREDTVLAQELGPRTLADLAAELLAPGRDPRGTFVPFRYREDVRRLEDLKPGMVCPGLVTNTTSFGVFVDLGVPQDGLVHVSQLPPRQEDAARPPLLPGDRVQVRVMKVDLERKQISLSMRGVGDAAPRKRPRPEHRRDSRGEGRERGPGERRPRPGARPPRERPAPTPPPAGSRGEPASKPAGTGPRPRPEKPRPGAGPPPTRPAFNNPFAVLAKLKESKKG
jgi:uncharacterized protein